MPLKESENSAKKEEEEEKAENKVEQDGVDQGEAVDGRRDEEEGHDQEEHREPLVLFNLLSEGRYVTHISFFRFRTFFPKTFATKRGQRMTGRA